MLAVILGRAELMLMREGQGKRREDLEAIALAAGDAAAMVQRWQLGLQPGQGEIVGQSGSGAEEKSPACSG